MRLGIQQACATILTIGLFLVAAVVAAGPTHAGSEEPDGFDGWIVTQFGESHRFPRADGWKVLNQTRGVLLTRPVDSRPDETVAYFGSFVAEEVEGESAIPTKERPGEFIGWTVVQSGERRRFWRVDNWAVDLTPEGAWFRRRGHQVWYYGTHCVESGR